MKAMVEKDACAGCGLCVDVCPDVFEMDAEDKAEVKVNPVPSEAKAGCLDAADQCPTSAILVDE